MVKVITPIGAVVEVDESVYENNKDTLAKYEEDKSLEDMTEKKVITAKDTKKK